VATTPFPSIPADANDEVTDFVRVGPTRVRVRSVGEGSPLLMLMGIGGNLEMWGPLLPYLGRRRLVMLDFPGTGESSLSFLPPTMGCNALLVRSVMRRLGLGRVDVLGYSWGGVLAQHLAIQHPPAVRRLVLASTTVGLGGLPPSPRVARHLFTARRYHSRPYFEAVAPTIYGGRYRTDRAMVEAHADERVMRPPSRSGYLAQLAALSWYSSLPGLSAIRARTLVLAGGDDPMVPVVNARLIACCVPRSTLEVLPDAGHLVLVDSPEVAGPIIDRFLAVA